VPAPADAAPSPTPARTDARVGRADRPRVDLHEPADGQALPVTPSDVPDVLAPNLRVLFVGINPGRVSAAAGAHFANPRNDFWRLLHDAGFTPRQLEPEEQWELPAHGGGVTNAAYRTTPGSGDLRRGDFAGARERLERIAIELRPRAFAFVGKEAYRGVFRRRPELGRQPGLLEDSILFVLPSTSPANAAVPYAERLRWFRALNEALPEPKPRAAVRALVLDARDRVLLIRFVSPPDGALWWVLPGGAVDPGESPDDALRRELAEEVGAGLDPGPCVWTREFVFPFGERWYRQAERIYLTRVDALDVAPGFTTEELVKEGVHEHRWWALAELETSAERFAPRRLSRLLRELLERGSPADPIDVGP
jgi:TDG/mug DNA glycosylase family protein